MCISRVISTREIPANQLDQATKTAEELPKPDKDLRSRVNSRKVPGQDPEADKELGKELKYEDDVEKLM
jgi:hypothetical protein